MLTSIHPSVLLLNSTTSRIPPHVGICHSSNCSMVVCSAIRGRNCLGILQRKVSTPCAQPSFNCAFLQLCARNRAAQRIACTAGASCGHVIDPSDLESFSVFCKLHVIPPWSPSHLPPNSDALVVVAPSFTAPLSCCVSRSWLHPPPPSVNSSS